MYVEPMCAIEEIEEGIWQDVAKGGGNEEVALAQRTGEGEWSGWLRVNTK